MTVATAITILGSTGSVGQSTLDIIAANPGFEVFALSANSNIERLHRQCLTHNPEYAVVSENAAAARFAELLAGSDCSTRLLSGSGALETIAGHERVRVVMAAIVGAAGLASTLAAVEAGKRVLLANKESLVMSGDLFMDTARRTGADIIPIDSEHNAVFQCLPPGDDGIDGSQLRHVHKIVLTASGGPFLYTPREQLAAVTPDQACAHPNWRMGRKISVDSATMMNKGLEFIEAGLLFGLNVDQIEVLIHPQSIIHSMVYYRDGSVLAQMANPDMRVPIAYGLAYPDRIGSGVEVLDLTRLPDLEFLAPDLEKFPCLRLGIEAARSGGTAPAILNAANEEAVAAFLREEIPFTAIPLVIQGVLSKIPCEAAETLAIIQNTDRQARSYCKELITRELY